MVTPVLNYLDDFLTISPQDSPLCASNLQRIKDTCSLLGIPLALEKVEGPSQSLTFWESLWILNSCWPAYLMKNSQESGTKSQLGYIAEKQQKGIFYPW